MLDISEYKSSEELADIPDEVYEFVTYLILALASDETLEPI